MNDVDVKCPVTGMVVDLKAEFLAATSKIEITCPDCGKVHVWNPARNRLVAPKLRNDANDDLYLSLTVKAQSLEVRLPEGESGVRLLTRRP
jgi:endogenous inhibitor of DNA gyrase (YacG/DUF329 family)